MDLLWFIGVIVAACLFIYWTQRGPARLRRKLMEGIDESREKDEALRAFQSAALAASQRQAAAMERIATALEARNR